MYVAETWIINVADWKKIEAFEMWCLRKMLKVSYTEHRSNENVRKAAKYNRKIKADILKRKTRYLGHILRKNGLQRQIMEAYIEGRRGRGRPRHTWLHNIKREMEMSYIQLVRAADDRVEFRRRVEAMVGD
jgi:hypothetical protein